MKKVKLGYSGWTNYETWLVSVHLIIEYIQEHTIDDLEKEFEKIADGDAINYKKIEVDSDYCEDMFYDFVGNDIPKNGIIADMVNASIQEIDFDEIADHVNDYLKEEAERLDDELRGSGRR